MLSSTDRAIMIRSCHDHDVAFCDDCARSYRVHRLRVDWYQGKTELCPRCRADLSESIREHLRSCELAATLRSQQLSAESRTLRDTSVALIKDARQMVDNAEVRTAEADAELQKRRAPPPPAD